MFLPGWRSPELAERKLHGLGRVADGAHLAFAHAARGRTRCHCYGLRVNAVAPAYIRTAQALSEEHSLGEVGFNPAASFIPIGRVEELENIADVIAFLTSDAARFITGQCITIDGDCRSSATGLCVHRDGRPDATADNSDMLLVRDLKSGFLGWADQCERPFDCQS